MGFSNGTLEALSHRGENTTEPGKESISLQGDLAQMGTMSRMLEDAGINVRHRDVYPIIQVRDNIVRALQYLWDYRVPGWWGQHDYLIEYGICNDDEYRERLRSKS
jgi:hypothetical protein